MNGTSSGVCRPRLRDPAPDQAGVSHTDLLGRRQEEGPVSDETEDSRALLLRITEETWTEGRLDLIEELVAENFKDHVEMPGLESTGPERYRASVVMIREAFPDYREEILWLVGEGDRAVS